MENPFLEDLLVLDTRDIKDTSVVETVRIEMIGIEQYEIYVEERLEKCEKPIAEVITKNKLALFTTPAKRTVVYFPDSSYLVRLEMETWIDFLPMKTSQLHHDQQPNQTFFDVLN